MRKPLLCFSIMIISSLSQAQYSERAKADLKKHCIAQDAKSCAYLGAMLFSTDKNQAMVYYKQACELGYSSSCVFVGITPVQQSQEVAPRAVSSQSSSEDEEVNRWIEQKMGHLLSALVYTNEGSNVSHFSVDQCRIPLTSYIMLVMRVKKFIPHSYKFGPGCDQDGSISIRLDEPFSFDNKVRKMEEVVRMTGEVQIKIEKLEPHRYKQSTQIFNVAFYDAESKVISRGAMTHEQVIDVADNRSATIVSNYGTARVAELKGKTINVDKPFTLDNIIKRLVVQSTPK